MAFTGCPRFPGVPGAREEKGDATKPAESEGDRASEGSHARTPTISDWGRGGCGGGGGVVNCYGGESEGGKEKRVFSLLG